MYVLFEEDGGFKAATVLTDNDATLQVETTTGKRAKIKSANVLLRFKEPAPGALLPAAVAGGMVSASASPLAFYALCAADPMAWIAADAVLCVPLIRNIMRMDYRYLRSGQI